MHAIFRIVRSVAVVVMDVRRKRWGVVLTAAVLGVVGLYQAAGCAAGSAIRASQSSEIAYAAKGESMAGLFQAILNVHDMNRQVAFYRDVMGFAVIYPRGLDDYAAETFVRLDTGGAALALHNGRTTENNGDEPRLSFMVDDIDRARSHLLARGVRAGDVRSPAPGVLVVDARDPEGNAFHIESRIAPAQH